MTVAPDPAEIFERAAREGRRRLDQSTVELLSTGFIAGFTVVFGIVALGIVEARVGTAAPDVAKLAGALAFGVGLVFLVVGRAELFNENFFDPIAAAIVEESWLLVQIARLWTLTLALNIVGGAIFTAVLTVEGALPPGTAAVLVEFADETVTRRPVAEFVRAITGGALVALLSFLLQAVDDVGGRITLAYLVGVLLPLGPFDHVVVTIVHVLFGILFGADIGLVALTETTAVVTAGNLVGGVGLVTLTHVGQALGAADSGE